MKMTAKIMTILFLVGTAQGTACWAGEFIKMATTTSTENSGLLDVLLPAFRHDTGIAVKAVARGTGAALREGMEGNVDVLFVHAKEREEKFVAEGYGAYRLAVMHNDFVIAGPPSDPAGIQGCRDAVQALRNIAASDDARFVSRGDDSGTHTKELALWKETGLPLEETALTVFKRGKRRVIAFLRPEGLGGRYLSIGQGMGKTLTFAQEKRAYTLTDRGTFLRYKYGRKQGLELEILCEGDPRLFNPYGVIPVNPERFPHVKFALADRFARWLVSARAQSLIAGYRIQGRPAFFPDAIPGAE